MPLTSTDLNGRGFLSRGLVLRWDRVALILLALVLWIIVVYGAGVFAFGLSRVL